VLVQQEGFPEGDRAFHDGAERLSQEREGARRALKIGYSYLNERNTAKAKENLNRVIKDYPGSKEAALAREKLKQIGK